MKTQTKIICLGHVAPRIDNCYGCRIDEYNRNCQYYSAISTHPFDIKEIKPIVHRKGIERFVSRYGKNWRIWTN